MTAQRPSAIVAAAARDVESTLNDAWRMMFAADPDSGQAKLFREMVAGVRVRLAHAVDEVHAAEPIRYEFPGTGGE